jgi:hypothetical protein
MQGSYNTNLGFYQKFVFCKNRGIHYGFRLRCEYKARTFGDIHFTARLTEKYCFPTFRSQSKTKLSV